MRGLGETIVGLRRRKTLQRPSHSSDDSGLIEVRGFGFNPGNLRMLAKAPDGLSPGAALVVVLHGCTQRAGPHAHAAGWLTLADRLGFAVLAPEQASTNNPNRCFNWFQPADIARNSGEAASIHAMVQHMVRASHLDPDRVFVTGLSAGGAMTAVLLAAYPETFAAGAVVAGLPFGVANNAHEAFAAMHGHALLSGPELGALVDEAAPAPRRKPRMAIWHGGSDRTVASSNARALAGQWIHVHGIAEQREEVHVRGEWTRSVWRGSDGEALVEMNLLAGLGHGTPLAASGENPIGQVAPFMLEAGVSSSLEIARFWRLAPPETASQADAWTGVPPLPGQPQTCIDSLGESIMASVSPHVSGDIQTVISTALTSAGLLPGRRT